jgi:flagellar hook-length control protein FliK
MLNPSALQGASTPPLRPSSPSISSTGNPAARGGGGNHAAAASSFSTVLAGEMQDRGDASPSGSPDAAPEAAAMAETAAVKHGAKAGSAPSTASTDRESKEPAEEGSPDSLAGILAGLGAAHPSPTPHTPASIPVDSRAANTRAGEKDSGRGDADADSGSASSSREGTARADIFPWAGSYGAGGAGTGGAVDAGAAKTYSTATENHAAGIQMAQGAQDQRTPQATGKQGKKDILLNLDGNPGKAGMERIDRADVGKRDEVQRSDFKFGGLSPGVADESERKTLTDPGSQAPLSAPAPLGGLMSQPMERSFALADTGATAPTPTMQDLQTPVGNSGWDEALGQRVLLMVSSQEQVAELSLNPPDLGPLQVTLSISNDQATATFVSQHADVRQALEAALPRLKEMMAESGINLGGASVSSGDGSQQQGFERQSRAGSRYSSGTSLAGHVNDHGTAASSSGRKSMLVDIFA